MTTYQKMGEWLVSAGLLNQVQLKEALRAQRAARGRLGEVLTAMGLVTEDQILMCLSAQYEMPIADLDKPYAEPAALRLVSHSYAQSHLFLPVSVGASDIEVICSDPIDVRPIDELTRITGKKIRMQLSSPTALYRAINRCYLDFQPAEKPVDEPELSLVVNEEPQIKIKAKRRAKIHSQEDRAKLLMLLNENAQEPGLWDKLTGS